MKPPERQLGAITDTPPAYRQPPYFDEDETLPHQIRLGVLSGNGQLWVSCNCLRPFGTYLEVKPRFASGEAVAIWKRHIASVIAAEARRLALDMIEHPDKPLSEHLAETRSEAN